MARSATRDAGHAAAALDRHFAHQIDEAAKLFGRVAGRLATDLYALSGTSSAPQSNFQDLSRAWAQWLSNIMDTNLHFSQDILQAKSPAEVAQAQARFIEQNFVGFREGVGRVLQATDRITPRLPEMAPTIRGEQLMAERQQASVFREAVLKQLREWAEQRPNELVLGAADSHEALTRSNLYEHVRQDTPIGHQLMVGWEEMAAKHVITASLDDDDDPPARIR